MTRTFLSLRQWLVGGFVLAIAAAIVLTSFRAPATSPDAAVAARQPDTIRVSTETVRRGDIQQVLAYNGDIRAREQVTILPKTAGRVEP